MKIAIFGQGYVGHAIGMAAFGAGHEVLGLEIKVDKIQNRNDDQYEISTDFSRISDCEIIIIAVPTPVNSISEPDLSFLREACNSISTYAKSQTLIINESTSYPGTLRNFIAPLTDHKFLYAVAPERIDPGNFDWKIQNTPRVVCGLTKLATEKAIRFYRDLDMEIFEVSTPEIAEAAKLLENSFRQINIAFINELSKYFHELNISTYEVIQAASTKPFGFMKFFPSLGVGGHCIPVDPHYLINNASKFGIELSLLKLSCDTNSQMPFYILQRLQNIYNLSNLRVQISGISYKSDTNDLRQSPALELIELLRSKGAEVIWHDEIVQTWNGETSTKLETVDLGIICTAHSNVEYTLWLENNIPVIDLSIDTNLGLSKFL